MTRSSKTGAIALGLVASFCITNVQVSAAAEPKIWDGVIVSTNGCDFDAQWQASYRPKIAAGDPASSIIVWGDGATGRIQKTASPAGNGQFSGSGNFTGALISDNENGLFTEATGSFTITQTPTKVLATTPFVEISAVLNSGQLICSAAFRGVFALRAPRTVQ
jgi:hypothetical protein